ncbi:MAG TPA: ABC transporter ATP-binding protein [Cellulomonas sp.]
MAAGLRPGDRRWLLAAAGGFSVHQVAEVAVPVLIGVGVQAADAPAGTSAMLGCLVALVAVFTVLVLGWRLGLLSGVHLATRVEHRLRTSLLDGALRTVRADPSRLISIVTADVDRVGAASIVSGRAVAAAVALLCSTGVLLAVSWPLAVVLLAVAVLQLVTVDRTGRRLAGRAAAEQHELGEATASAADLVSGVRVLHGIGGAASAAARYRSASRRALDAGIGRLRAQAGITAVGNGIAGAAFALTAALAARTALGASITPGDLVTVVGVAAMLPYPLGTLVAASVELSAARGAADRVAGALAGPPAGPPVPAVPSAAELRIRLAGLEVLLRRGELVGLDVDTRTAAAVADAARTGGPGATVLIDGVRVSDPARLRAAVFAPPSPDRVFTGSLAENLFADLDPSLLRAAGVDDVLGHLRAGVDSPVGEQGSRLSGGQRQRVLLARALHQPQPFLLLHEPLSSVDALTAERVVQALGEHAHRSGRGLLVSTNQPRLLACCDRVLPAPVAGGPTAARDGTR